MIVAVVHERDPATVVAALRDLGARFAPGQVMAEVRLDALPAPDPEIIAGSPVPVIATCRRPGDGGAFVGSEAERLDLLWRALQAGARHIDVEMDVLDRMRPARLFDVIASRHDLRETPLDLESVADPAFREAAVQVVKLAVFAHDFGDVMRIVRAGRRGAGRVVAFGLGPVGVPTRLLFRRLSAPWVYALWRGPDGPGPGPVAPGLPLLDDLVGHYYADATLPSPAAAFGVVSDRALDSIGPWVFNRVFRKLRLPAIYVPVTTRSLVGLPEVMEALGLRGLSVTTPFKEAVLDLADEVHPLARAIGAANTLVKESRGLVAYNSDYRGVLEPVTAALGGTPAAGEALVVGAGGAGAAAALALAHLGFTVTVSARTPARAADVARRLGVQAGPLPATPPRILVNATPCGGPRDPSSCPVPGDLLTRDQIVLEMNYRAEDTPLVALARARGARVIDGAAMYAAQAGHQIHHFWAGLGDVSGLLSEAVPWAIAARASS